LKTSKISASTLQYLLSNPKKISDHVLPLHIINELLNFVPTADEVAKLNDVDVRELATADLFMLEIASIPFYSSKLGVVSFYRHIAETNPFERIRASLSENRLILTDLFSNLNLKDILKIALMMGNELHGSDAVGFRLSFLPKLKNIRVSKTKGFLSCMKDLLRQKEVTCNSVLLEKPYKQGTYKNTL
jgi:hypothetical protein